MNYPDNVVAKLGQASADKAAADKKAAEQKAVAEEKN